MTVKLLPSAKISLTLGCIRVGCALRLVRTKSIGIVCRFNETQVEVLLLYGNGANVMAWYSRDEEVEAVNLEVREV